MNEISNIGNELVEYAENEAVFTAQRGLIDELFPFIYMASKRMSLRAISRWLSENKRVEISANAISKAMRNKEKYWQNIAETVAPAALKFASAYDFELLEILKEKGLFEMLCGKKPDYSCIIIGDNPEEEVQSFSVAKALMHDSWFSLPIEIRTQCMPHLFAALGEKMAGGEKHE